MSQNSAITRSATASRRCTGDSKRAKSGNPRPKNWPALLVEALNEPVVLTIEGAPRDHQVRGGRHSAGNKSTSHSRSPMAQIHGGVIRRPEGAPEREKSAAILCHPGAGRDQFSRWASALRRCDEASGTGVKRLKGGALDIMVTTTILTRVISTSSDRHPSQTDRCHY